MKKLAVVNQKGGVAKTTLCIQTSFAARDASLRVLLVDLDPQGSLSTVILPTGADQGNASPASALFAKGSVIRPEVLEPGFAIIRKDDLLEKLGTEDYPVSREDMKIPAQYLRELASEYDICIIDTPGALGDNVPTTTAALIAADAVVCPFAVGLLEAGPLSRLWKHLNEIILNGTNPRLRVLGLIPSKVNVKSGEELGALETLRQHPVVGKFILPGMLGERAAVKQAIARRKPVWRGVRGAGHKTAAVEWKTATTTILKSLGVLK